MTASLKTDVLDALVIIAGAFAVGGAAGWTAAIVAQAVNTESEIDRLRWGEEGAFALTTVSIVGVLAFWFFDWFYRAVGIH